MSSTAERIKGKIPCEWCEQKLGEESECQSEHRFRGQCIRKTYSTIGHIVAGISRLTFVRERDAFFGKLIEEGKLTQAELTAAEKHQKDREAFIVARNRLFQQQKDDAASVAFIEREIQQLKTDEALAMQLSRGGD